MKNQTNVWQKLSKPIFALAPMEDVTDTVFRQIIDELAPADLYFTEFTSIDALLSEGRRSADQRLLHRNEKAPIIAQIWGNNPNKFFQATRILRKLNFDGIDINLGCPEKKILKQNACGALIKNPKLVKQIIDSVRKADPNIALSVKTRIGFNSIETEGWIGFLLKQNLDAITVHARTVREMSSVPAHWEELRQAVRLRNKLNSKTLIIGNGDVADREDGLNKIKLTSCDGVMIGRGVFHNLYAFSETKKMSDLTVKDRLSLMKKHIKMFKSTWGSRKNYSILKKFYKIYLSGFDGAVGMRVEFMNTNNYNQALDLINKIKNL